MSETVVRPLVAGEEELFESLPGNARIRYADGLASGGYHPSRTWVALAGGRVVARAAWVLPPGAVGGPWLEVFDVAGPPRLGAALLTAAHEALGGARPYHAVLPVDWRDRGAAVRAPLEAARLAGLVERGERLRLRWTPVADGSQPTAGSWSGQPEAGGPEPAARSGPGRPESDGSPPADGSGPGGPGPGRPPAGGHPLPRYTIRAANGVGEIDDLVARIAAPDVLTGAETAAAVAGLDLAAEPRPWFTGEAAAWRVAFARERPVGLLGTAGDACWPMVGYLGVLDAGARAGLVAEAVRLLTAGGAEEIVADVDADRTAALAELSAAGFVPVTARVSFVP